MTTSVDPLSTLAFCWRVERSDGAGVGLTSHDAALIHDGEEFQPAPGIVPASISRRLGLEPHSGEVAGVLSSNAISEHDLGLGRWDGARVTVLALDWQDQTAAATQLIGGELGEVATSGSSFSAELRGVSWKLNAPVCPSTSPECRAELGDKKCRVDLAGKSMRTTVTSASGVELELSSEAGDQHVLGRLRYLSGENCGASTIILGVAANSVRVRDLPRAPVEPGCRVELREGCDKSLATCSSRFGNAVNFRGEPHLPGNDLLTRYPGA